jgi:hypothetical protein
MRWFHVGELACACIDAPHPGIVPTLHAATLEAINRRIGVLPVRFGLALRDETEIHSLLQNRNEELLDHLNRLDSACEMGLRIAIPNQTATPNASSSGPQSSPAYLELRRAHYRQADDAVERDRLIAGQYVDQLQGCYREWRQLPPSPSHPIRLAFLVDRGAAAAFLSRVENARQRFPEGRCSVLGPWPPYSFV